MSFVELEEAISLYRKALLVCPLDNVGRPVILGGLAHALCTRHDSSRELADLKETIDLHREVLKLYPLGDPNRLISLYNLALSLERLFIQSMQPSLVSEIRELVFEAIHHPLSSLSRRFTFGLYWSRRSLFDGTTRLRLYSDSLTLLYQLVAINPSLNAQLKHLTRSTNLAANAAREAILYGDLQGAVSMLERGRQVLLSSIQNYRTPVDVLYDVKPELAERFISIGSRLEHLSTVASTQMDSPETHRDDLLRRQRDLVDGRNAVLEEVRDLPGFGEFLLPLSYSKLQSAAEEGPVIIVTGSQRRCDALIIASSGDPVLVPLTEASPEELFALHNYFIGKEHDDRQLRKRLRSLWKIVVSPVVSMLLSLGFSKGQRIWWCPASIFTIFPLHTRALT